MAVDWRETSLGDLVDFLSGGTPSKENATYWNGSVPWASAKDMKRLFLDDTEDHLTEEGISNGTKLVPANTVLLLTRGMTLLNDVPICIVRRPMTFNQDVKALRPKRGIKVEFLPYLLLGNKHRLLSLVDLAGHGTGRLNTDELKRLGVLVPPESEQLAIARILGTLDDKIELNSRMNQNLEAMARALFKSWFVDFDPVRAKGEGRDPGLPKPLADLFPDSFEDSELGEIPKAWEVKKLSELCSTQYGYTASAVTEPVGPKFIRVTDINKRNWIEWANVPHCQIDAEARMNYALQLGDIVVARMADPGKSAIIEEDIDAVFASYLVRLKTKSLAHSYYVYGFLKSDLYLEYAEGVKSGSVQANMNARVIVGADVVVPSPPVMERFLEAVLPLRRRLAASIREAHTLALLRDTLLPKLISGKVRVKDAERFVEAGV